MGLYVYTCIGLSLLATAYFLHGVKKIRVLDANTLPPAANSRSEQNTNTGSVELWAL